MLRPKSRPKARVSSAREHLRQTAALERRGVDAANRACLRIVGSTVRAFKATGGFSTARVIEELRALRPLLRETMVAAHLQGTTQELAAAPLKLDLGDTFRSIIRALGNRSEMDPAEIRAIYDMRAVNELDRAERRIEQRLQAVLQETTRGGAHVREGVKALRSAFDDLGLTPTNSFQLEAIFRTQTQLAYGAGRWQADQHEAIQEILWGYQYATVGDDRVRPTHAELDGMTAPKDHPVWRTHWPPNGWACRCVTLTLFDEQPIWVPNGNVLAEAVTAGFGNNAGILFATGA